MSERYHPAHRLFAERLKHWIDKLDLRAATPRELAKQVVDVADGLRDLVDSLEIAQSIDGVDVLVVDEPAPRKGERWYVLRTIRIPGTKRTGTIYRRHLGGNMGTIEAYVGRRGLTVRADYPNAVDHVNRWVAHSLRVYAEADATVDQLLMDALGSGMTASKQVTP